MTSYRFEVPMASPATRLKNTLNQREHWSVRHRRVAAQKRATRLRCPPWLLGPLVVVRLTRVGKGRMDDDGVVSALKGVRDAVATWLRVDDASPLVRFEYAQEKGEPKVVVEVEVKQ